ncbi:MAG: hypothetical protein ACRDTT_03585 [Pseudonocardiaceae bacterium]
MEPIPRSTRAGRGELSGPAPSARQVRSIDVTITQVSPGVMQLSTQFGWRSGLARTPAQFSVLVASAFVESQVAAYARFRGYAYNEFTGEAPRRLPPVGRRGDRYDTHDPRAWRKDVDGLWIAPGSGRKFHEGTQVVQRVKAKLAAMWEPEPQPPGESGSA